MKIIRFCSFSSKLKCTESFTKCLLSYTIPSAVLVFYVLLFIHGFKRFSILCSFCSREKTPTSELYGDSEQVLVYSSSTSKKKSSTPPPAIPRRKVPDSCMENMPSAAELEEFFAAAEKYEQKRFAEK